MNYCTAQTAPPDKRAGILAIAGAWLGLLLLVPLLACKDSTTVTKPDEVKREKPRVLFIGNSHTYTNNVPAIVAALAEAAGEEPLVYSAAVVGGFSLEDHWNRPQTRAAISEGGWNVVVLQQGASASTEGRGILLEYAQRFSEEIRQAGARPALYMPWPSADRRMDFTGSRESYAAAAQAVDGMFFPAGEGWSAAWRRDPTLEFYSFDSLHATPAGSYLAALVIYQQLYNRSPVGLPSQLTLKVSPPITIDVLQQQAATLQAAAAEANEKYGRR